MRIVDFYDRAPLREMFQRADRQRKAGEKLAQRDWSMFREPRYQRSSLGTMAKIPDIFIHGYLHRYGELKRGRP